MKIKISQRQVSKNYFSRRTLDKFKSYAKHCTDFYQEYFQKIELLEIVIVDSGNKVCYGNKSKPMLGFTELYKKESNKSKIYLYRNEGYQGSLRRIAHEIVHAKQSISGEMKIIDCGANILWKGRLCHAWKKINWSDYDNGKFSDYVKKLPWEVEVNRNPRVKQEESLLLENLFLSN
jgi:hypothetical protein